MQSYIQTMSSPKLVCILNHLTTRTSFSRYRALRTIQYIVSYTLTTDEDYVAILPSITEGSRNTGSYLERVLPASEANLIQLNASLESILAENEARTYSTENLRQSNLLGLLTDTNAHFPCTRVLIALVDQDIGADLAALLLEASELYPNLRVFFFTVATTANHRAEAVDLQAMQNIESLACRIGAVVEYSDVDVGTIANRADRVQSYLNYLTTAGTHVHQLVHETCLTTYYS